MTNIWPIAAAAVSCSQTDTLVTCRHNARGHAYAASLHLAQLLWRLDLHQRTKLGSRS